MTSHTCLALYLDFTLQSYSLTHCENITLINSFLTALTGLLVRISLCVVVTAWPVKAKFSVSVVWTYVFYVCVHDCVYISRWKILHWACNWRHWLQLHRKILIFQAQISNILLGWFFQCQDFFCNCSSDKKMGWQKKWRLYVNSSWKCGNE